MSLLHALTHAAVALTRYITALSGKKLFTHEIVPPSPRGVLCYCHGYSESTSWSSVEDAQRLAKSTNMVVAMIDYPGAVASRRPVAVHCAHQHHHALAGHGKSDGLLCYIPDFDDLVTDVGGYFDTVSRRYPGLPYVSPL